VAPKFEQANNSEEPEVSSEGEKVYPSFYYNLLKKKQETQIFEKELDLDLEL
jgi:hypothetical protein